MPEDLDHRTVVAGLAAEDRRVLCRQSDGPGLRRLSAHLGLVVLGGSALQMSLDLWYILLVPQGILLVFLFSPLHECIHRTAFRTPWLNTWAARLCGFAVLVGPTHFRYFHLGHHRHTHDPVHDPELTVKKPGTPLEYLAFLSGLPDWAWRVRTLVRNALWPATDDFLPARARGAVRRESLAFVAAYAVLFILFGEILLWAWLVPLLIGGPFLRAFLLAEHGRCPHVANILRNTRTTLTTGLVRWLSWNMPYHVEHHAHPAVPFHQLPRFHRLVRERTARPEPGYAGFNRRYLAAALAGALPDTPGRG